MTIHPDNNSQKALAEELADDEFSARGNVTAQVDEVDLSLADEQSGIGIQTRVGSWAAAIFDVTADSVPPKLNAGGEVETALTGVTATILQLEGGTSFSSEEVKLAFEKYQGTKENESIVVDVTGSTELKVSRVSVQPPGNSPGQGLNADLLSVRYAGVRVNKAADT